MELSEPRELVANHLDVDLLTHTKPDAPHEVFIDPWFELAHPAKGNNVSLLWQGLLRFGAEISPSAPVRGNAELRLDRGRGLEG